MGWNIKQNADGTSSLVDGFSGKPDDAVQFGRGATDTDITFVALRNSAGTLCYVYPDTAGTAIVVSATKP